MWIVGFDRARPRGVCVVGAAVPPGGRRKAMCVCSSRRSRRRVRTRSCLFHTTKESVTVVDCPGGWSSRWSAAARSGASSDVFSSFFLLVGTTATVTARGGPRTGRRRRLLLGRPAKERTQTNSARRFRAAPRPPPPTREATSRRSSRCWSCVCSIAAIARPGRGTSSSLHPHCVTRWCFVAGSRGSSKRSGSRRSRPSTTSARFEEREGER